MVRAAPALSLPFPIPAPFPPLSVFSALGAGKALGPRARVAPRTRAGRPPRVDGLRPLPRVLPPGSSRPPLPPYPRALGLPLPRAGDLHPRGSGAIFDVSWVGGGRLELSKVKSQSAHFTSRLQTLFSHPFALSELSQPPDSPLLSLLSLLIQTHACLILKPPDFWPQDLKCRAVEFGGSSKATSPSRQHPSI